MRVKIQIKTHREVCIIVRVKKFINTLIFEAGNSLTFAQQRRADADKYNQNSVRPHASENKFFSIQDSSYLLCHDQLIDHSR